MDKRQLKILLGQDALDEVIARLNDQANMRRDDVLQNQLVMQRNRLHACRQHAINGTLPPEEIQQLKNQVISALLTIIDSLESETASPRRQFPLLLLLAIAAILLAAIAGWYWRQHEKEAPATLAVGKDEASKPVGAANITFPGGDKLTFHAATGLRASFTLLEAGLQSAGGGRQTLTLKLRCNNEDRYPINFWDDSFRLETKAGLQTPKGGLNEVVPGNSNMEGTLVFDIDTNIRALELVVFSPFDKNEQRKIPLNIQ